MEIKLCSIPNCTNQAHRYGLCKEHIATDYWKRVKRQRELEQVFNIGQFKLLNDLLELQTPQEPSKRYI